MVKIRSVAETVKSIKESNVKPRKFYNKGELTELVLAFLTDPDFTLKVTKLKKGEMITDDRKLGEEFVEALVDVLKGVKLNEAEARKVLQDFKVPKKLASVMIDVVSAAAYMYMDECQKGFKFMAQSPDLNSILYIGKSKSRKYKVPERDGCGNKEAVIINEHRSIKATNKYSDSLKTTILKKG